MSIQISSTHSQSANAPTAATPALAPTLGPAEKLALYLDLAKTAESLMETDWLCNLANMSALLKEGLPDLNWSGFYLLKGETLVLGPFQGLPACMRIPLGRGVCGTAAARQESMIVADVEQFPGHIACDSRSRSELVVPLVLPEPGSGGRLLGVLDLDSPSLARFDDVDRKGVERLAEILIAKSEWPERF